MASTPVGPTMTAKYPEVEAFVRITPEYSCSVLRFGDKQFEEQVIFYAHSNFFDLFEYRILDRDPTMALTDPFSTMSRGKPRRLNI